MSVTWDSWIPVVRSHLSEILVDHRAMRCLRAIARHLPSDCLGAIEVRLASGSRRVDFSLRLSHTAQAQRLLNQVSPAYLRTFLSHWSQQLSHFAPVASVWLEFDLAHPPRKLPVPVLCVQLRNRVDSGWLINTLLPAMRGRPLNGAQRRVVSRCIAELPAKGKVLYVFGLLSRPGDAVRLELFGLDPAAMVDYLERIAAPEAAARVAALAPLIEGCERPHLSFDIGTELSRRIGIEGSFARQPDREPRWAELFDRLVVYGLCAPDKRDAVFAWPGYDSLLTAADRWPDEGIGLGGFCVRGLSHVKLVSWPDRDPEAKAYLLFQHLRKGSDELAPTSE